MIFDFCFVWLTSLGLTTNGSLFVFTFDLWARGTTSGDRPDANGVNRARLGTEPKVILGSSGETTNLRVDNFINPGKCAVVLETACYRHAGQWPAACGLVGTKKKAPDFSTALP